MSNNFWFGLVVGIYLLGVLIGYTVALYFKVKKDANGKELTWDSFKHKLENDFYHTDHDWQFNKIVCWFWPFTPLFLVMVVFGCVCNYLYFQFVKLVFKAANK